MSDPISETYGDFRCLVYYGSSVYHINQPSWQASAAGVRHQPDRHNGRLSQARRYVQPIRKLAPAHLLQKNLLPWKW
ncbi:MAG TPA: hypothetical protein VFC10_08635 [Terriglobia bacterium]|nr:hypothetical protein [Terriglobia bacterium]